GRRGAALGRAAFPTPRPGDVAVGPRVAEAAQVQGGGRPFAGRLVGRCGQGRDRVGDGDGEGVLAGGAVLVGDRHGDRVAAVVGVGVGSGAQGAGGRGGDGGGGGAPAPAHIGRAWGRGPRAA